MPNPRPAVFWETTPGMACQFLRDLAIRQELFVDNKTIETAVEAYDLARLIYIRHTKKEVR